MITTNVALFDNFSQVVQAVKILQGCGFSRDEISVVTHKNETKEMCSDAGVRASNTVDKQKLTLPADLGTFVVNTQSLFVRGIGWVAAAGPLALILAKATDKAQFSNLTDALLALDVSDEEAECYAEGVRRGGTLLTIFTTSDLAERAEDVMLLHGAVDMRQRALRWRQQGWLNFSPTAEPYPTEEMTRERRQQAAERKPGKDWSPYDRDFRGHFYLTYSDSGIPYEHYAPAYRYGHQLASDIRYDKRNWDEIETQARRVWERQDDKAWETVADAVCYGFLKDRGNNM